VSVHRDVFTFRVATSAKVAGVACEHVVLDLPLSTLSVGDQFRDATKMMVRFVIC
jgi:hypothetical protein